MTVQPPGDSVPPPQEPRDGEEADIPVTAVPAPSNPHVGPPTGMMPPPHAGPLPPPPQQLPIPMPPVSRAPAGSAFGYPADYSDAPGSAPFQFALPQLGTIVAGPAVGSMVAGIAGVLVAFGAACAGLTRNLLFTISVLVLAIFCAATAGLLAGVSLRQIRRSAGEYRGRGMAIAGAMCGVGAVAVVLLVLLFSLAAAR